MTCPKLSSGELLTANAGLGEFSSRNILMLTVKETGAKILCTIPKGTAGNTGDVVVIVSFRSFPRWRLLGLIALFTSAIRERPDLIAALKRRITSLEISGFLKDKDKVDSFVQLVDPLVRALDGITGEKVSMRVGLDCTDGKNALGIYTHKKLSVAVGVCIAAFARAVLEGSTKPGVWYPEEVTTSGQWLSLAA
ncbi:hypothetical protein R1flu_012911 [Riccia fluitans]|uniref:Uncharacterized protein n=1 Tax=Riccia fluitans TaxID=41844 RepID=A0ABD1ZD75_9MARC